MHARVLITLLYLGFGTATTAGPNWSASEIEASRVIHETGAITDAPAWFADPSELLVIEGADPTDLTLLDGLSFDVLGEADTGFAAQGTPVFSPDGRYMFRLSSDGWVQKIDLWTLDEVAQVRAALSSADLALSHDGAWLAVANDVPGNLTILASDDLSVATIRPIKDKHDTPSGIIAIATRPTQESFILTLSDVSEIHEVFYGANPPFYGFVHDYRIEGPPEETETFPMRYITVPEQLGDFQLDPSFEYVMAAVQEGTGAAVVDLVIGHKIAAPEMPGRPDWVSAVTWQKRDQSITAAPHLTGNGLSLIDMMEWETIGQITTDAPVGAVQGHAALSTIWVIAGTEVQVIDTQTFAIVTTFQPLPGATPSGMAFTRDGAHVFIAFAEEDAVIVLNTTSLAQVQRIKTPQPSRIYSIEP